MKLTLKDKMLLMGLVTFSASASFFAWSAWAVWGLPGLAASLGVTTGIISMFAFGASSRLEDDE